MFSFRVGSMKMGDLGALEVVEKDGTIPQLRLFFVGRSQTQGFRAESEERDRPSRHLLPS